LVRRFFCALSQSEELATDETRKNTDKKRARRTQAFFDIAFADRYIAAVC